MKKIGLLCREKTIEVLDNRWKQADACIVVSFNKIPAFSFNTLRNELDGAGSSFFVAKNTLIKRALAGAGASDIAGLLQGSTGIIFTTSDGIVSTAKTLAAFSKENEGFLLQGGFHNGKQLSADALSRLSTLPGREVLLAQAVMMIAAPLSGFAAVLNNVILKFVWLAEALKKKKEGQ